MAATRYWLVKSEPDVYSIDDLAREKTTSWEGVRNYQARNFLREMKRGELLLFYHSSAQPPGVAGVAKVARAASPDETALDPRSPYFDPKATREDARWSKIDVTFVEKFAALLPLEHLRTEKALAGMELLRRGSRLSVQTLTKAEFDRILRLGRG